MKKQSKVRVVSYNRVKRKPKNLKKKSRVMAHAVVMSSRRGGDVHMGYPVVRYKDRTYGCTCESRLFRRHRNCKHIRSFVEHEKQLNR